MLHVTNGDSSAQTLRQTTLGGTVLAWRDTLHEGPVPELRRRELLQTRANFLAGCGVGSVPTILTSLEQRDTQFLEALRGDDEVVLCSSTTSTTSSSSSMRSRLRTRSVVRLS